MAVIAPHCADKGRDRSKGDGTEGEFAALLMSWGYGVELHPSDVDMFVDARVEPWPQLHEVKGKQPTRGGRFGLEAYRLDALLAYDAEHPTFYTIHNDANPGKDAWITARVSRLPIGPKFRGRMESYHGDRVTTEDGFYWPVVYFDSLAGLLAPAWWWHS